LDADSSTFCKCFFLTDQLSVAASFLVSSGNPFYQWAMLGAFTICGVVFICVGIFCADSSAMKDLSKMDTAKSLGKGAAKGAAKGATYAYENQELL
jgi:hypothetical protein